MVIECPQISRNDVLVFIINYKNNTQLYLNTDYLKSGYEFFEKRWHFTWNCFPSAQ